ncbi:bifunctional diaminohydroxyphosphoribosylaminopyrimidine deaminase/5-amino-6-(5-phosphoribosylamino)uracil reductase RibD [Gorillibacterium massiliense]|uniref:bifunctional diaminohydroxyphosphoribosylaminopyrimidine deaminase/5-amino-6-(5-phosphoribosylamino)uracil reductase RibD n=1 Tax=Gorillibacterium massiliense TaxID=1280390 RepID=UPI0004ACAF34|nr:bifunctional diaminohydroxyphosphoribosylaminopyrimidine deaminase/5-amino-6-(5-phosphoribosylamino)uracil reductase RibD [Gorillibacterium massiliense]
MESRVSVERLTDETYMDLALNMARTTQGQTGINPVVGCVVVKDGRIVGMGAHLKRGTGHAEVHALNMAGAEAEGATVYVTLEPCSHYGKTPPCSERIIAEKAARVVVGAEDPNPLVAGRGIQRLREAGIEVTVGVRSQEATLLNEMFNKYIVTGMPFVTAKSASTLDGRIASYAGDSKWITGESAREFVHLLRHRHQAIMVGVGTALADDPQLTTRLPVPGLSPVRVVVDSELRLPPEARLLAPGGAGVVVVTTERAPEARRKRLEELGAKVIAAGGGQQVDLQLALKALGGLEIGSVLLEGGGRLNGAMLRALLIDKFHLFFAPKIIGGADAPANFAFPGFAAMDEAFRLERIQVETFGDDFCVTGYPVYAAAADREVNT